MPVEEPPVVIKGTGSLMVKVLLFVLGFTAAFVLLFFMIIQPSQEEHAKTLYDARQEWSELEAKLRNDLTTANNELNTANHNISNMETEIANLETINRRQNAIILITQAYLHYQDDYLQDAIDLIDDVTDFTSLPPAVNQRLEIVRSGAYPRLAVHYFNQGTGLFADGQSEYALAAFRRAYRFFDGNMAAPQMPELLFRLGSLSVEFSMNLAALDFLNLLQEYFPNHRVQDVADLLETILGPLEEEE